MDRLNYLLKKYRDRLIIIEEKKSDLEVLRDLVDLSTLVPAQKEIIKNNIRIHLGYKGEEINLHLHTVEENAESRLFYEEILALGRNLYLPYFDEPKIMAIWDETFGLQEVDSNLLYQGCILLRGLTLSDIEEKDVYLIHYVATIAGKLRRKDPVLTRVYFSMMDKTLKIRALSLYLKLTSGDILSAY
ncbi:hypothetical protein [Marinilactibacillus psychrotolerans]|uniref:hypothetical protein n=1 Tax=Marinilactibacillus psychrotolerans TaxID=191770 RepID=UPI0039B0D3F1